MKRLCYQIVEALDLTAKEILLGRLTPELEASTLATLGMIAEEFGSPTGQDIVTGNKMLRDFLAWAMGADDEAISPQELCLLRQLYATKTHLISGFNDGIDEFSDLPAVTFQI